MEIITGYVGKPHVTSEQDRDVHIGIIGSGSYVLQTGKQMTAEISSNNEIKVRDGVLMHQGCAASIKKNTYDSLSIVNGSQGMKRIDLIVARYERNKNTGVESLTLKVLKGTPASANPATPAYTTGDIQAGDYIADMPMYKVTLDGINITKLEKQFQTVETNAALTQKVNVLNSTIGTTIGANTNSTRVVSFLNGSIKIAGMSKVVNMTSNYIKVTDHAEICKLFGLSSVDSRKVTIISNNGDWNANNANFFAPTLQNNGTWWQYSNTSVSGATPTRLNIFIIYIA